MDGGEDDVSPEEVVDGAGSLNDVFVVDDSGRVHVAKSVLLENKEDVFDSDVCNAAAATTVNVAPAFDAIDDWLATNDESTASVQCEPLVKILAKRSSSDFNSSNVKRARPNNSNSLPKDLRVSKVGMSNFKKLFGGS
ncbi:hypothetical protein V6N12_067621 [Hibiscus sabdariffa]|uniref:Uncharacterized protein n=1 Tax=Hibiscus sabdariffa TaxID=183260 RepID=A0ABR2AVH6_9ROSI